jgi:hypothetical protein
MVSCEPGKEMSRRVAWVSTKRGASDVIHSERKALLGECDDHAADTTDRNCAVLIGLAYMGPAASIVFKEHGVSILLTLHGIQPLQSVTVQPSDPPASHTAHLSENGVLIT